MKKDTIFEQHPTLKKYFQTSDGTAFYTQDAANNHAKTLSDKEVKEVERNDEPADEPEDEERTALIQKYTELYGQAPAKNIGLKKLQERIAEKEAELNQNQPT